MTYFKSAAGCFDVEKSTIAANKLQLKRILEFVLLEKKYSSGSNIVYLE